MRVRVQKTFEAPIHPENTDFVETDDDSSILLEDGSTETLLRGYFVTFESITTDGKGRRDEWTMQWEDPGLPTKGDYYDIEVRRGDVTSVRFVMAGRTGGDNA